MRIENHFRTPYARDPEPEKFHAVDPGLVDALRKQFPVRTPSFTDTDRQIGAQIGRQEVIDFLASVVEEQSKDILEDPVHVRTQDS